MAKNGEELGRISGSRWQDECDHLDVWFCGRLYVHPVIQTPIQQVFKHLLYKVYFVRHCGKYGTIVIKILPSGIL